jgi:hypothetical protein
MTQTMEEITRWPDRTRFILSAHIAALRINAAMGDPKRRQFCRKCIRPALPAATLTFDDGARRLHWCIEHARDADRYRDQSDQG